jgi:hypothetical protein
MKKILFLIALLLNVLVVSAQTFMKEESDTTVMSEYNNGHIWAYRKIGDFVVGMTNYKEKDNYGRYYQIVIFIKNLGESSVVFDPDKITSSLYSKKGEKRELLVYSYDGFMKMVKRSQAATMALLGFSAGMNAGMASYQTTYTTTYGAGYMPYTQVHTTYNPAIASALNMSATTQLMSLSMLMNDENNTKSQGYLRITTIHPNEGIIGYMNIKRKKGASMTVNIPINGQIYSFDWNVAK